VKQSRSGLTIDGDDENFEIRNHFKAWKFIENMIKFEGWDSNIGKLYFIFILGKFTF